MPGSLGAYIRVNTGGGSSTDVWDIRPWLRVVETSVQNQTNQASLAFNNGAANNYLLNFGCIPTFADLTVDPVAHLRVYNLLVGGAGQNYVIQYEWAYKALGESGTSGIFEQSTSVTESAVTTTNYQDITFTLDRTLMSAGDFVALSLTRLGADLNDTRVGNMQLVDILIRYTVA